MIILYPFELLLSKVFLLSYSITGHYGYALIIMSAIITALTTPLYMLAERWKNNENAIKLKMRRQVDCIKENFKGQKQYYLLQTTHRIYGYKSWYPLQTSMGIIFQIPFFFAAYNVLSHFTGYNNVSFGPIKNLSAPDGIIFGINLLPLLMTLLNILSSFYYTRSCKIQDNTQQLILAGVFLLLLYDSPSALLLYWTCNNFLSLIKNIITSRQNTVPMSEASETNTGYMRLMLHTVSLLYILITLAVHYNAARYSKFIILASVLFLGLCFMYVFFIKKNRFIYSIIPYGIIYAAFMFLYLSKSSFIPRTLLVFLIYIFNIRFVYLFFSAVPQKSAVRPDLNIGKSSYYIVIAVFSLLFAFLLPGQLYINNPAEFQIQPIQVVFHLLSVFVILCVILLSLGYIFKSTPLFFNTLIFFIICFCFYTLLLPLNAGNLSEFTFQNEHLIREPAAALYIKDFIILLFSFYIVYFLTVKKQKLVLPFVALLTLSVLLNIGIKSLHFTAPEITRNTLNAELPATNAFSHKLSKTGRNVVFIMSDMMNGNYVKRTFEEMPELKEKYGGFTWYRDMLSISASTAHSMPAMMGGAQFSPLAMNATDNSYHEDQQKSVEVLFSKFLNNGYITTNLGYTPMFQENEAVSKLSKETGIPYIIESAHDYLKYWNTQNNISLNYSAKLYLLGLLPIYNAVPYTAKALVYNDGSWNNLGLKLKNTKAAVLRDYSYLDLMPEIFSVSDTEEKRFIFILNGLSHDPFGINKDGNFLSGVQDLDDPDLPYYSSKTVLVKVSKWIDWLKENGVYDNTLIIIVSDHGNFAQDNDLSDMPFKNLNHVDYKTELSRAYPALLFKDFNADSGFHISDMQVQNSDVPLIFNEYVFKENTAFSDLAKYTATIPRNRTYSLGLYSANDFVEKIKLPFSTYRVRGSIFNADSWEHIDE